MFPCQLFVTHPAQPNLCVVSVRGFLKSQGLTGEEQPLPLAEVFSSDCSATFSTQFLPCVLSFASYFLLPTEISSMIEEGREQGMMRVMMLWFFSPFALLGLICICAAAKTRVNFLLLPGLVLNVTSVGVRIDLEFVTSWSGGICWKGWSGLGKGCLGNFGVPIPGDVQGTTEVALSALGWDKVGTGHSLASMILEIFSNYNDSVIL